MEFRLAHSLVVSDDKDRFKRLCDMACSREDGIDFHDLAVMFCLISPETVGAIGGVEYIELMLRDWFDPDVYDRYMRNKGVIDKIIEVGMFAPNVPWPLTTRNVVLCESSTRGGQFCLAKFRVGCEGYFIDYENGRSGRAPEWDCL